MKALVSPLFNIVKKFNEFSHVSALFVTEQCLLFGYLSTEGRFVFRFSFFVIFFTRTGAQNLLHNCPLNRIFSRLPYNNISHSVLLLICRRRFSI